jgi:hypothetical protein
MGQHRPMDLVKEPVPVSFPLDPPGDDEAVSDPDGVILTWIHGGNLRGEFVDSVFNFMAYDILGPQRVKGRICASGPYIVDNRNTIAKSFLEQNAGDWLWSLDIDVQFGTDVLDRMMEVADAETAPIVGALYFAGATGDPEYRWWPVWRQTQGEVEYGVMPQIRIGDTYENLASVGMGCTLIHRSVLEAMRDAAADEDKPIAWYGHDYYTINGLHMHLGEDLTFCKRARNLGFSITGLAYPLGHVKTITVTAQTFTDQFRPPGEVVTTKPKLILATEADMPRQVAV